MPKTISYAALAAALAIAGPSLAQSTASSPAGQPGARTTPPASSTAPLPATPSTSATPPSTTAPASAAPPASSSAPTGASTDTAANAGASTALTSGMSVKDNTGALIGEVRSVKGGVATIAMGPDTFTVDSNKLAVQGGAATINASQAELKKMLPPKK
jgi:hypothetical protein